jgi:2-dehydro-3-deoxyphosphogalactonate aldolase
MTQRIAWPNPTRSLVAILRGVKPDEVEAMVGQLVEAGFELIEVPLNSPDPFVSIEKAAVRFGKDALIGAGTVLTSADCARVADAGGRLMVSPNVDADVLAMAVSRGMVTMPGVFTPTEAFLALRCGASALKFFPASVLGPSGIAAQMAVLPKGVVVGAVGGVSEANLGDYAKAGVRAFGLGSSLYRPGMTADEVRNTARASVRAYDDAVAGLSG